MLTITPTAADILTRARSQNGAPDDYGVRFHTAEDDGSGQARLAFTFVESPGNEDTIIDADVIDAYVAPDVERLIGDVTVDVETMGDQVGLVVRPTTPS
jgi:Fe-S cluster assembly iron-binding protein IscA